MRDEHDKQCPGEMNLVEQLLRRWHLGAVEITGLVAGDLEPELRADAEAHLERCPECAEDVEAFRQAYTAEQSLMRVAEAPAGEEQEFEQDSRLGQLEMAARSGAGSPVPSAKRAEQDATPSWVPAGFDDARLALEWEGGRVRFLTNDEDMVFLFLQRTANMPSLPSRLFILQAEYQLFVARSVAPDVTILKVQSLTLTALKTVRFEDVKLV